MKITKILCVLLAVAFLLIMTACGAPQKSETSAEPSKAAADAPKQADNPAASAPAKSPAAAESPSAAKVIEPAVLITEEQAKELLGGEISKTETKEQKAVGQKLIVYESGDKMLQVGLQQQALMKNGMTPESIFRTTVENFKDAEKAEGIGDEAYFFTPGIHIMKSGYYITISLGLWSDETKKAKLTEAAKVALAGLEAAVKG